MPWVKLPPPDVPSLETANPSSAKRFTSIKINELLTLRSDWIKSQMEKLGINTPQKAIEFVITKIDYPFNAFHQPCDDHTYNAYCSKACYKITLDYWDSAFEVLMTYVLNNKLKGKHGVADCLTGDTKIITVRDGKYNIETLNDLRKYGWKGVKVLSYNFKRNEWVFKPIINFYDRGVRDTWEVTLRNGTSFRVADKHKMYVVKKSYTIRPDAHLYVNVPYYIDLMTFDMLREGWNKVNRKSNYQLPLAKKIPALGTVDIDRRELYIEGHYVAEGWSSGSHVGTSGDVNKIKQYSDELGISYNICYNSNGVAEFFFRKSYMKERLSNMGHNAFDKHFLDDRLSLNEEGIKALLSGYIDGDGYVNNGQWKTKGKTRNIGVVYNTSSDRLAEQLCFMTRVLGKYFYKLYQINHQGLGKHPIWRIYVYNKTRIRRNITPYLANISIKSIEYQGRERVYDIEVADTHNFVLADSGILVHNCDGVGILGASLLRFLNVNAYAVMGVVYENNKFLGGHCWAVAELGDKKWHLLEMTMDNPLPYPSGYPVIDISQNKYKFRNITYEALTRFNEQVYEEWGEEDNNMGRKFDQYVRFTRRDKSHRKKVKKIKKLWEDINNDLRRNN